MIPLTLRAMLGKRHPAAPRSGRSVFSLLSVLALLALACFPVLSRADGVGAQYEPELPKVPVQKKPSPTSEPKADISNETNAGGVPSGTGDPGSPGGGSSSGDSSSGATPNPSTGGGSGNGQGSPGNGSPGSQQGTPVSAPVAATESSSSPLVPILIAIAALAAISIGAVVVRQRRRGPEGAVSPKAS
jgi:hypothetical protein